MNRPNQSAAQANRGGLVVWITGLSGAGKSTLAKALIDRWPSRLSRPVHLDGDALREIFGTVAQTRASMSRDERRELALRYSRLVEQLSMQSFNVVISTISLFREVHIRNREHIPNYVEVYLKVPMEELRRRDSKGLYKAVDEGRIDNVAGVDFAVDEPESPDVLLPFQPGLSIDMCTEKVLSVLERRMQ